MANRERDLVAFAQRVLALLDQGSFVATYKYAVLLALLDLCLEKTNKHGAAPDAVTTRELAEKIVELYWPQTAQFHGRTLRQNAGSQARILSDILAFRDSLPDPSVPLARVEREAKSAFVRLVQRVEWTLILMPLPRLQVVGRQIEPLLYEIRWSQDIERKKRLVTDYQKNPASGTFDNRILLYPNVSDYLVVLNGLLRPLIHRAWSAMVARLNGFDESRLERFLFGVDRKQLAAVRPGLLDLQDRVCFYCGDRLKGIAEVDHFIPWARYPDNGIDNLVVADGRCNASKRDFLAASGHVQHWRERQRRNGADLQEIAARAKWESHSEETLGVARGLYLRLPAGTPLWVRADNFLPADPSSLRDSLS